MEFLHKKTKELKIALEETQKQNELKRMGLSSTQNMNVKVSPKNT